MWMMTVALWAALTGCVEDVGKDKVQAVVEDAQPEAVEKEAPATDGTTWAVDTSRSKLHALGAKVTKQHPIVFPDFEGQIRVSESSVTGISFSADMSTLEADHPKLTAHLKDEDFFDVANHPTATFEASKIAKGAAAEGMTHTVTGALTIRGTTKQVTFPAKIEVANGTVTANTQFTIDRQDFGVTYPGRPDDLVQDNVVLTIDFVAEQPAS
jgi:polyisoprenoid-binding protein YceI